MARHSKIIDTLENSFFATKFIDIYAGKMTARDIIKESGLPAWFVYDLFEQGIISEDKIISIEQVNIILTAVYCYSNPKFIRNSFRNLNRKQKDIVLRCRDDTPSVKWVNGRIETLVKNKERVETKTILKEVFNLYPKLYLHESRNMAKLSKIIVNYKRYYRRKLKTLNIL